ncbi:uncharacterized protein LOC107366380 isoform X2 [Tetranychus urticae]|uniref:EGF-like domain-containing protein n=1 Tax=Tetranychus urticae TaxID=32264 RepID=T1KQJ6_TETUR|nr:uncharacterized protein LOC107366380 isoform X2 [Tetranychus urticae]
MITFTNSSFNCYFTIIFTLWPFIINGLKLYGTNLDSDLIGPETAVNISSNETYPDHLNLLSDKFVSNGSSFDQNFDHTTNKLDDELTNIQLQDRKARTLKQAELPTYKENVDNYNGLKRLAGTKSDQHVKDQSLNLKSTRSLDPLSLELYDPQVSTLDGPNSKFIEYQNDGIVSTQGEENTHSAIVPDKPDNYTDPEERSLSPLSSSNHRYHWTNKSLPGIHFRSLDSDVNGESTNNESIGIISNQTQLDSVIHSSLTSTSSPIKSSVTSLFPTALGVESHDENHSNYRLCSSPYNCHLHLNERCVSSANFNVCQCVEPFHRTNHSEPCRIKKGALITVSFGNLIWSDDLANIYSPRFIETKDQTERSLRVIMDRSPLLASGIVSIGVLSFSPGSVSAKAMVHVRNDLFTNNFKVNLAREMTQAVADLSESASSMPSELLFRNVTIKAIQDDIDPCGIADLNYCSPNSVCLPIPPQGAIAANLLSEPGFRCQCKPGFTDLSPNPYYPGEVCRVECPLSYCENGGHCLVNALDSTLYCTCQDWNVGPRCQYSGILVFSVLGVVVILLMLIVACTTSAFCGKRVTRETVFSRRVSPVTYDDTIRPFRIAVNNYDSPEMTNGLIVGNSRRMDSSASGGNSSGGANRRLSRGSTDDGRGKVKPLSAGGASGFKDDCLSEQANRLQGLSTIGLTQANLSGY